MHTEITYEFVLVEAGSVCKYIANYSGRFSGRHALCDTWGGVTSGDLKFNCELTFTAAGIANREEATVGTA